MEIVGKTEAATEDVRPTPGQLIRDLCQSLVDQRAARTVLSDAFDRSQKLCQSLRMALAPGVPRLFRLYVPSLGWAVLEIEREEDEVCTRLMRTEDPADLQWPGPRIAAEAEFSPETPSDVGGDSAPTTSLRGV